MIIYPQPSLTLTGLEGHICPSLAKIWEGHICPTIVTSLWLYCDIIESVMHLVVQQKLLLYGPGDMSF